MVKSPFHVLIVDDDAAVRQVLCGLLSQAGMSVAEASSAREAELQLEQSPVDVVVSDVRMPGTDGLALLRRIRQHWPEIGVVMLTAHGTIQLAVEAMKSGASEFMLKPFEREEVLFVVRKVGEQSRREGNLPPRASSAADASTPFVAQSPLMAELGELIRRAASGAATVLIRGETGTGKELVARAIHEQSARRSKPFIKLNCAALPDSLLESELFGYEPGPSREPPATSRAGWSSLMGGLCSWTRSATSRSPRTSSCCVSCKSESWSAWVASRRSR